ncbi:MAG: tetratricopeptide repeat protein [Candidatus Melainabacteria bacterium]|nr:tetratricopeptide repeat protein [Candidatus Melainabacteria bacterium]
MMSRFSLKTGLQRKLLGLVLTAGILAQTIFPYSAVAVEAAAGFTTFRQALKNGLKMKVNGDGVNTTQLSLQLTNTSPNPMQVVIPANEMLKPNTPSVQNMMVTTDQIVNVAPGQTAIVQVQTVCASVKTVPPPPQVTEGLNFEVGDYQDPAMWAKISTIIAASKELAGVGAFGNLVNTSDAVLKALVDQEVQNEIARLIDQGLNQLPEDQRGDAQRSTIEQQVRKNLNDIQQRAERKVFEQARQAKIDQITQLAIWKILGIASGNPADRVDESSIETDFYKALTEKVKADPKMIAKYGGQMDKNGNYQPGQKQKEALSQHFQEMFDAVNLTVSRAGESNTSVKVAALPNNDPCDTFCNVGERAFEQGDYAEAQALLQEAVNLAETFGETDPRLSRSLNGLGMCYLDMDNVPSAEKFLKRAFDLRNKVFGPDSREAGESNDSMGLLRQHAAKYVASDQHFSKAIQIYDIKIGTMCHKVAGSLNNLGKNYILEERASEANQPLARALSVAISNCPKDAKGHILHTAFVAEIETNLANAYVAQNEFDKAIPLYEKALTTDEKRLGLDHPFVACILEGMANAYSKAGKSSIAEGYRRKAEDIRHKSLGEENKEIASLPMGHEAFTRLWNYVDGSKEITATVNSVKAGINLLKQDSSMSNVPIGDKWALVIGISKFADSSINLQYSSKDASDFANFLRTQANFTPDHVHLLTNEKATRAEIMGQLGQTWLPRVARPQDLVIIYLSTHGSPSTIDAGSVNYLVAYDSKKENLYGTGINLKEFENVIKTRLQCKRVVVVLDACHSGVAAGAKGIFRAASPDVDSLAQGTGQFIICSSGRSQTSWESKRYDNGVFTHYLMEGLKKQGEKASLGELFDFVSKNVAEEVQRDRGEIQTPAMQTRWEGKDLNIAAKPADPKPDLEEFIKKAAEEAAIANGAKGVKGAKGTTVKSTTANTAKGGVKSAAPAQKPATTVSSKTPGAKKPQTH